MKRLLLFLLVALLVWLGYEWLTFPDVRRLASERPESTAFMELRKKQLRGAGKSDELEWRWVPYDRIAPHLRRAVLVAEDSGFYEHEGVDVKAMREALERNWKRRRITHGGSTITQQLAKNLYLSPSRNPARKAKEYILARSLERNLSKKRILEIYLNVVELGERVYGVEAAARHYFGKSAAGVTPAEAALLAGALPNPRRMNPASPNARLRARQKMILSRMRRWGHLAERELLTETRPERNEPEMPPAGFEEPSRSVDDVAPDPGSTETSLDRPQDDFPPPAEDETSADPFPNDTEGEGRS